MWEIFYTKQSLQDARKITDSKLRVKIQKLIELISKDPYIYPPKYEVLKGELKGFISRRINSQHRLVYQVLEQKHAVRILKMWTHYE